MAQKKKMDFKALMLAHVEKLACGVIALCFVFLLWAAFSREPLKAGLEPEEISAEAQRAKLNIQRTTWEDFSDKPQMRNFAQESGWYDVPTAPYLLTVPWNPDLFPKQDLRDDPKYYPIQEPEAHFDQGPLVLLKPQRVRQFFNPPRQPVPPEVEKQLQAARTPPEKIAPVAQDPNRIVEGAAEGPVKINLPGAKVEELEVSEGRRWVMVKALLPWQEQIDAYVDKFRNAAGFDQKNDLPLYFGYEVERADVTGGVTPVWQSYEKVSNRSLQNATIRWATSKRIEIIAKPNRDATFTCPLPPRVLALWGTRDKHSKIPLEGAAKEEAARVNSPMPEPDMLGGLEETVNEGNAAQNPSDAPASQIAYKMLRYFDFNVLPGHAYQYRFRAALRDPNYVREGSEVDRTLRRVELKLLEEHVVKRINEKREALEKEGVSPELIERYMPVVYTDWSDPSPVVKIPPDNYILALKAEQPPEGRYNVEPWVHLLVTKYDAELGIEVGAETKLQRGNLANFAADGIRIINVDHSTLETRQVPFSTNNMLLDIRGGNAMEETGLIAPTEVLLFDLEQGGKLVVADEVEDAQGVLGFRQRKLQIDNLIPQAEENNGGGPVGPRDTDIIR
jgi:hypothetical protein